MNPDGMSMASGDRAIAARHRSSSGAQVAFAVLFGGLAALIILILTERLDAVLPDGLAEHVARNNEGFVFALLFAGWIEYARDRVAASTQRWTITAAVAVGCAVVGTLLLVDGVPGTLATLNESCFALALLVPYVQLRRPVARWTWALPFGAVLIPLVGAGSDDITDLAEFFGFLLLVPIALDLVDRSILDPSERHRPGRLVTWMAVVVLAAVLFHTLRPENPSGVVDDVLLYLSRTVEALVAVLILHLYFSIVRPIVWKGPSRV